MSVFVLRHADKSSATADTLSQAGRDRAALLARMLGECPVRRIFHTELNRSKQTAAPLHEKLQGAAKLVQVDLGSLDAQEHAAEVVKAVKADAVAAAEVTVVLGHSDTVGPIIHGLGGPDVGDLEEFEFDRLFLLCGGAPGRVNVLNLRYGAATPRP